MNNNMIVVGMADLNVVRYPGALTTLGLGSCVGIALYDNVNKVAGLAHAMLPESALFKNNSNTSKFVDTSIKALIIKMRSIGAKQDNIKAKVAGGAQMFAFNSINENMRIGDRNIEATLKVLKTLNIPIISKDVGSNYGRTIELYTENGKLVIKTIGHGTKTI